MPKANAKNNDPHSKENPENLEEINDSLSKENPEKIEEIKASLSKENPENVEEIEIEKKDASLGSVNELLKEELEKTKIELKELKDTNLRQLAEIENTRKRLQKERQELTKYAISKLVEDFLPPLDQLERALGCGGSMSDEVKNWAMGFNMILSQFKDVFSSHNIIAYSALGAAFDPHLHEAVEVLETEDEPEWKVLEEFACGYKMGDLVIRPAKVKVAKKPKVEPVEQSSEEEKS